jgi:spermidine synthase
MNRTENPLIWILDFLIGKKVLYKGSSFYNGEIVVLQDIFGKSLLASGLTQSGGMIESLWKTAISGLKDKKVEKILILGLGAGSCLSPIRKRWPKAQIRGVEIDPKMVELGEKFFKLSSHNLEIKIEDASDFITKNQSKYDLILIDLFSGEKYPEFLEKQQFLKNLKKILGKNGFFIFNCLYFKNHRKTTEKYFKILKNYFSNVNSLKFPSFFPTNLLIFCQN